MFGQLTVIFDDGREGKFFVDQSTEFFGLKIFNNQDNIEIEVPENMFQIRLHQPKPNQLSKNIVLNQENFLAIFSSKEKIKLDGKFIECFLFSVLLESEHFLVSNLPKLSIPM